MRFSHEKGSFGLEVTGGQRKFAGGQTRLVILGVCDLAII